MTVIRAAKQEDIPRILELYDELVVTAAPEELKRTPVTDDFKQVFTQIQATTEHESLVAEEQGEVIGTMVLIIVPNLSHGGLP
jgi:L-amino acid N-acyltransferase YncA